jgi:hypothetical protein
MLLSIILCLRWANEHLLRSLAGPMTSQDMISLFNPVPFGEFRETALQLVLAQAPQRWEKLRNIEMDKQDALLEVRNLRQSFVTPC